MKNRYLIGGALMLPVAGYAASASQPNILIIQCDQLSKRVIERYGESEGITPVLDSMARAGVVFGDNYVSSPISQPSRTSLWTGLMPHQVDVRSNSKSPINMPIADSVVTLGELFSANGYDAAHFGKCHDKGSLSGFRHTEPTPIPFSDPLYPVNQDSFKDVSTTRDVVEYLRARDAEPFICIADLQNPHNICGYIGAYAGKGLTPPIKEPLPALPDNFEVEGWEDLPLPIQYLCCSHFRLSESAHWTNLQYQHYIAAYRYYTRLVCRQIEQILEALHSTSAGENTIVVFTADHGDGMASHRMVSKQISFYEEVSCVPLIFAGAGIVQRERIVDELAMVSLDLLPTLCGLAGIDSPEDRAGVDWSPLLRGEKKRQRGHDYVVSQWHSEYEYVVTPGRMVRSERWKYIHYLEGNGEELYDMKNDRGERVNLAKSDKHRAILEAHRAMLKEYAKESGDDYFSLEVIVDPRCREHKLGYQNHVGANAFAYAEEKQWRSVFTDPKAPKCSEPSFDDGLRIKVDFTRGESDDDMASILFATDDEGKSCGEISFISSAEEHRGTIRAVVHTADGESVEVAPTFDDKGLFQRGKCYHMVVSKVGEELILQVSADGRTTPFVWKGDLIKDLKAGHVGLRATDGSQFKSLEVLQRVIE